MKKPVLVAIVTGACAAAFFGSSLITGWSIRSGASVSEMTGEEEITAVDNTSGELLGAVYEDAKAVKGREKGKVASKTVPSGADASSHSVKENDLQDIPQNEINVIDSTVVYETVGPEEPAEEPAGYKSVVGSVASVSGEKSSTNTDTIVNETEAAKDDAVTSEGTAGVVKGAVAGSVSIEEDGVSEEKQSGIVRQLAESAALAAVAQENTASDDITRDNTVSYAPKPQKEISHDPGDGFERSYQIGTDTSRCIKVKYSRRELTFVRRTLHYDTGDFDIVEYFKNGKMIDEDDYEDDYEDALEDMWEGKCSMDVTSSQSPIIVQEKVK